MRSVLRARIAGAKKAEFNASAGKTALEGGVPRASPGRGGVTPGGSINFGGVLCDFARESTLLRLSQEPPGSARPQKCQNCSRVPVRAQGPAAIADLSKGYSPRPTSGVGQGLRSVLRARIAGAKKAEFNASAGKTALEGGVPRASPGRGGGSPPGVPSILGGYFAILRENRHFLRLSQERCGSARHAEGPNCKGATKADRWALFEGRRPESVCRAA